MIRYRRLGQVALNVSKPKRSRSFYENVVGLRFDGFGRAGESILQAEGGQQLVLFRGKRPGLKWLAWEMEDGAQLVALIAALDQSLIRWRKLSADAIETIEPNTGVTLRFIAGSRRLSDSTRPATTIGHVVLQASRYREAVQFFREVTNFHPSDEIEGRITFLRCFPNPLHHSIAIANGSRNLLHHLCFMVPDRDDLNESVEHFRQIGVPIMSGPGHHPPSGSSFVYFLDPDGLTLEYSHGMERIAESNPRHSRVLSPAAASLDFDASPRDPRMFTIGDIGTANDVA